MYVGKVDKKLTLERGRPHIGRGQLYIHACVGKQTQPSGCIPDFLKGAAVPCK
jgi:hypothetical protein